MNINDRARFVTDLPANLADVVGADFAAQIGRLREAIGDEIGTVTDVGSQELHAGEQTPMCSVLFVPDEGGAPSYGGEVCGLPQMVFEVVG